MGICGALPGHADKFYSNKVIMTDSSAYAGYDCNCKGAWDRNGTCPEMHDNHIFTPDGKMADVCKTPLPARQASGIDIGTSVSTWPADEQVIAWARELLDLPA